MECRELTERAVGKVTGQITRSQLGELEEHCARCPECAEELLGVEQSWRALENDPDARVTPALRNRALAIMEDQLLRQRIRDFQPRRPWVRLLAQAAGILLAAGLGWLAHLASSVPRAAGNKPDAGASRRETLDGTLSNVSYRPLDANGRVAVSFDMTSRRTVVGKPEDPAVANLLAYLVSRGSQTSGEKSQAIGLVSTNYAGGDRAAAPAPEIVAALTATLKKDQNPGVRKKAADALAGFPMTPVIRAAFLEALGNDPNPGVRLAAVDALASAGKQTPDERTIESLRARAFDPSENGFVRAKAASALKAMEF